MRQESRLLLLSAADEPALAGRLAGLGQAVAARPGELDDIAFTLAAGRRAMSQRAALVLPRDFDPVQALEAVKLEQVDRGVAKPGAADVAMMFPGQGSQFVGMGRELYELHPRFREILDFCDGIATPRLGLSLRELIFRGEREGQAAETLKQTAVAQPALFVIEYALAEVLRGYGVVPSMLIGHSIGEFAAACLAGVFEPAQALELVIERGRLMQSMPPGAMLAVRTEPEALEGLLEGGLALAAHNAPGLCVVSGPHDAVEGFAQGAGARGLESQALHTSHAFHSAMMDPILGQFAEAVARQSPRAPNIPIISGLTGRALTEGEARSPEYWANQLRHTVRFADGVRTLCDREERVLLEVGPGTALMTSAAKQTAGVRPRRLLETLGHPKLDRPALESVLRTLGRLWIEGARVDFDAVYDGASRRLVRLPTYPYTRARHWVSVPKVSAAHGAQLNEANGHADTSDGPNGAPEPEPELTPLTAARARLDGVIEGRLGRALGPGEMDRSFVELGFDSLALSQLSGKVRQEFAVRVPFRRFFEDLGTPVLLAQHLAVESKVLPLAPPAKKNGSVRTNGPKTAGAGSALGHLAREPQPALGSVTALAATARTALSLPRSEATDATLAAILERLERIERQLEARAPRETNGATNGAGGEHHLAAVVAEKPAPVPFDPKAFEPTAAQREIWIASSVGGTNASLAYNECRALSFSGELDVPALAAALDELSERHEALRQTFSADGDLCLTGQAKRVSFELIDLSALDEGARRDELERLLARQTSVPFDLERGPLVRAELIKLAEREHALSICAHHIVVDGSSFGLLTRELAELYSARVLGRPHGLLPAESFAKYAAEENAYAQTPAAAADQEFWIAHLKGQSEDLTLPTDGPRPAQRTYRSTRLDFNLDAEMVAKLRELSAGAGATMQTLLMAAFQLLLYWVTRQTDIVVGVPTSGQAAVGLEALVGHCVHVLPLRILLDPSATFSAHAKQLNGVLLDGLEHQRTTFSDVLHRLDRPRDPSRIPLIPVAFGMGRSLKRPAFHGLDARLRVVPRVSESFELYVYLTEDGEGLEVSWSYNQDLFSAASIEQWQRCFTTILASLCRKGAGQRLDEIDFLDRSDRELLLELAKGPTVPRAAHVPVADLIAARAAEHPERTALIDSAGEHSYAALSGRANQLARVLRAKVAERNALIAVCLDRSVDLVCTLLGVWRGGFGYVPLDPGYPPARIEMILEDASASLVLTSRALAERIPDKFQRVYIEDLARELALQAAEAPEVARDARDIAYVIFTSGSTGRPKGVAIQQGAFENFIRSMQKEPGFTETDRLLAITTISFDIAGLELFLPLSCGGSIILATREQAGDPRELQKLLREHSINVLQATPATWQMLFDSGWGGQSDLKVLCGGEALPRHLAEKFIASCGEIWNVYGPTETTVWSTAKRVTDAALLTIGKPIDNTTCYVLGERRELLPLGTSGELWIGGSGVALGYLGRDDLTAERFVPSPFDPADRIYKTGDLARVRRDGEFECLGRADFQVKIRGYRIELGEIETAILQSPAVRAAVVVAREDRPGNKLLVGYVVLEPGASLDVDALRAELGAQLPAYMVPSAVCVIDAMPMTPNNKVDRKALPAPTLTDGYRPPEEVLRKKADEVLWQEVWSDAPISGTPVAPTNWLLFVDDLGVGSAVAQQLESRGHVVTTVHSRDRFYELGESEFALNPERGREDFERLVKRLEELGRSPDRVVHLWLLGNEDQYRPGSSSYHRNQEHGLYSLLHLATAQNRHAGAKAVVHHVIGNHVFADRLTAPQRERSTILGACRVVPNELARQQVRALDLEPLGGLESRRPRRKLVERLLLELLQGEAEPEVRYRDGVRQKPSWRPRSLEHEQHDVPPGSALIVGLTEVGLASARALARCPGVSVAVVYDAESSSEAQREALARLEASGVVGSSFVADTTSSAELGPILDAIRSKRGPIRTLVLAAPAAPPMPITELTESAVEAGVAFKLHSLLALERVLPMTELELTVIHTNLEARLGAPGFLAESIATAFVERTPQPSAGRRVVCHWGVQRTPSVGESRALSQVERDREFFQRSGLTSEELDVAAAGVLRSASATLSISPFELSAYRARLMLSSAKDSGQGSGRVFVEPATETERRLARLWMEALRLDRVSTRDAFFDLGGHSLLAARLFAKLHAEFNVTLPLSVLFEAPTIEALAGRIDAVRQPGGTPMVETATEAGLAVRLHVGSDPKQPPLFIVGGAMGNVLNLRHLARICDPRRDFYGIQARGLTGEAPPHRSLVEAGRTYWEEVRRIQPKGPYYIGGFCIGGVAALEMARLIQAEGEEVGLLAMLDSHLPEVRGTLDLKDRAQIQFERLRDERLDYVREWARGKVEYKVQQLRRRLGVYDDDPGDPTQYRSQLVNDAIMYARSVYEPSYYDGDIVVFRPPLAPRHHLTGGRVIDRNRGFLKADNGWTGMVRSLRICELACPPGEHDGFVLEPFVRDLARRMREFLPAE